MRYTRRTWQQALVAMAIVGSLVAMTIAAQVASPPAGALPPPAGRMSHGAAGTARNGFGGSIAPSPTSASWPGTGPGNNGGAFAFSGAQYGSLWNVPTSPNNSAGVGYCVMEDEHGEGTVARQPDPAAWDGSEMARAAALMSTFGGDRVVPYGINDGGGYNVSTGEWEHPMLFGGPVGSREYTRRRHVAVNFGVRMFLDDLSPTGVAGGRKLARDTAVVNGSGGEFAALRNGYVVAQYMAAVADIQHASGGISLEMMWGTPGGARPVIAGTYPLEVRVTDSTGKRVGLVPVLQLSVVGIEDDRSSGAVARVNNAADAPADLARWNAARAAGWPVLGMNGQFAADARFSVAAQALAADVADSSGVARFDVEISGSEWELAFHAQAPTSDVDLYAGSGVQGQATWAGEPQSASVHQRFVIPDSFVTVAKTSTDPAVSVAGTEFALLDGSGDEVGRATVGSDGRAPFAKFSPVTFESPYVLREISSAPGLERITVDIAVPNDPPLSSDPSNPTVVAVSNTALRGQFRIRKELDDPDVQGGRDMSGFAFAVTRVATGATVATAVTGTDGRTTPIDVVFGEYRVGEIGRPEWATSLTDGGPITFHFDPAVVRTDPALLEVNYTNFVPHATITTAASDRADSDQYVSLGATGGVVVDTVSYCGLVPGTAYRLDGEIQLVTDPTASATPTGITATETFVPNTSCDTAEVVFDVPTGSVLRGGVGVVFERLALPSTDGDSSAAMIAEHADPRDVAQTIWFPDITSDLRRDGTIGAGMSDHMVEIGDHIVDVITYSGLRPSATYRADLTLYERHADGSCVPTETLASEPFTTAGSAGTVSVGPVVVPRSGVFVGFERIYSVDEGSNGSTIVATHEDCDDQRQTVWSMGMVTTAAHPTVVGAGTMVDLITVTGLADSPPRGATVVLEGFLHAHGDAERDSWSCTTQNRVGTFEGTVTVDGAHQSPGEQHLHGWHSYNNRFAVTFADSSAWTSGWHGCRTPAESFEALAPTPAVPTTTAPASPPGTSPAPTPRLALTGGRPVANSIRLGGALVVIGVLLALLARRARHVGIMTTPSRTVPERLRATLRRPAATRGRVRRHQVRRHQRETG